MTTSVRSLTRDCFFASLAFVLTVWASIWLLKNPLVGVALWLRTVVVLLPVLPMAFAIRAVVRIVLAGDEMQRRIDLEAIAIAALAVSLGTLTLSLLMVVKVVDISGKAALVWVFPTLWVAYVFARGWAARRYR